MCRGEDAHKLVHISSLPISQGKWLSVLP